MAFHPVMKRLAIAAALSSLIGLPAAAQGIDLSRATCADFSGLRDTDQAQMAVWLSGFYAGAAQRPQLDPERLAAAPGALAELCTKSPQLPLVGAETRGVFVAPTGQ
jgi:hypothetical protein